VEKRRIITFYFKTSTVDVGEWIQPQQHWSKQHSKAVTPQEWLLSIRDEHWTGLGLDWIRTMTDFVGFDLDCKLLQKFRITTGLGLS